MSPNILQNTSPTAKRSRSSSLARVELDHSACHHRDEYDKELTSETSAFRSHAWRHAVFMTCIHTDPEFTKEERWKEVHNAHQSEFEDLLKECKQNQNFNAFRNLKIFSAVKRTKFTGVNVTEAFEGEQMSDVAQAWRSEYVGDSAELFINAIQKMNRERAPSSPYANYVSIIQSSGTGKSRLVDQTACSLFCIPFNLRGWKETKHAFPPPDDDIRDFLTRTEYVGGSAKRITRTQDRYDYFLAALFDEVTNILDQHDGKFESYKDLACWWRAHVEKVSIAKTVSGPKEVSNRQRLYAKVSGEAETKLDSSASTGKSEVHRDLSQYPSQIAIQRLLSAMEKLLPPNAFDDGAPPRSPSPTSAMNKDIRIMMYFDEAHTLDVPAISSNKDSLSLLRLFVKTLNNLSSFSIFSVFISTDPNMSALSPSQKNHRSGRVDNDQTDYLQAPYTELPFDCSPDLTRAPFNSDKKTIAHVNRVEWMGKFGRPLFWSRRITHFSDSHTLELAYTKLSCGNARSESFHLAALTTRLSLQLDTTCQEGLNEAVKLVESHMRVVFCAPSHQQYLWSGTPSEPLLAEAAVRCMAELRDGKQDAIAHILAGFLQRGIADKGERGELVARHLLTEAMDKAAKDARVDYACRSGPTQGTGAVSVEQFLVALLGKDNADKVLDMRADNMGADDQTTLRKAFRNSVVRFTHFVRAGDDYATSSDAAFAALGRGFAIICRPRANHIDIYISVVIDKDKALSEANTTAIFIQVKDTERTHSINNAITTAEKLRFFRKESTDPKDSEPRPPRRPYIFIVMELGVQPSATKKSPYLKEHPTGPPATPPKSEHAMPAPVTPPQVVTIAAEARSQAEDKHPRYSIVITGCSRDTYGVVHNKDIYAELLGSPNLLREHPRQEKDYISAVKRLKPMWIRGEECWGWVQSDLLSPQQHVDSDEIEEGIKVNLPYVDEDD